MFYFVSLAINHFDGHSHSVTPQRQIPIREWTVQTCWFHNGFWQRPDRRVQTVIQFKAIGIISSASEVVRRLSAVSQCCHDTDSSAEHCWHSHRVTSHFALVPGLHKYKMCIFFSIQLSSNGQWYGKIKRSACPSSRL